MGKTIKLEDKIITKKNVKLKQGQITQAKQGKAHTMEKAKREDGTCLTQSSYRWPLDRGA